MLLHLYLHKKSTILKVLTGWIVRVLKQNKAGYMATKLACGWAGAIFEVTGPFGQEQ